MPWLTFIASACELAALKRWKFFGPELSRALMVLPATSRSLVVAGFLGSRNPMPRSFSICSSKILWRMYVTRVMPSGIPTPMNSVLTSWMYLTTSSSSSDLISTLVIPRFSHTSAILETSDPGEAVMPRASPPVVA